MYVTQGTCYQSLCNIIYAYINESLAKNLSIYALNVYCEDGYWWTGMSAFLQKEITQKELTHYG